MATSLTARAVLFGDGVTDPAQDLRLGISGQMTSAGTAGATALASRGGVRLTGVGTPLAVSAGSGMAVAVAVGQCFIPAASGDSGGLYQLTLDTGGSLTVATSNPTNPRIDLIVAQVVDVGSSSTTYTVNIITGTPGSSPAVPATPAGALALAKVLVPAASSSVSGGNITDLRQWSVTLGGILPVKSSSAYPANGSASDYFHNLATGRLVHYTGSGTGAAPLIAGFAPVTNSFTSTVTCSSGGTTVQTTTVTVDGASEVRIVATYAGVYMPTLVTNAQLDFAILLDGTQIDGWYSTQSAAATLVDRGGTHITYVTPAAGAHTITWTATVTGTTDAMDVYASATTPGYLRAEPCLA